MLNKGLLLKVIYKKEVLIVNFYDEFILSFFTIKDKWLIIPLYNYLKNYNYKVYFNAIINDSLYSECFLCAYIDQYFITIDNHLIDQINNHHLSLIVNFYNNLENNLLFSFDEEVMYNNLTKKLK